MDIVDMLNTLSDNLIDLDLDMKLPAGSIDPREAAEEIERLIGLLRSYEIGENVCARCGAIAYDPVVTVSGKCQETNCTGPLNCGQFTSEENC